MMLFVFSASFVFLTLVDVAVTQQDCSKYTVKKDFDLEKYNGDWIIYGLQKTLWNGSKSGGNCKYVHFYDFDNNCQKFDRVQRIDGKKDVFKGYICATNAKEQAKLSINITSASSKPILSLWILETDYTDFVLAIRCDAKENSPYVLIQTRNPFPNDDTKTKFEKAMKDNHLDPKNLTIVDHSCFKEGP